MKIIKLISLIFLIVILAFTGYKLLNPSIKMATINIPIASYDFGRVKYGDIPSHEFEIKNIGNSELIINKISTSCGCTTAEISKNTIASNESATITVYFNPAIHKDDTDLGELTRVVYINTNDPISHESEIKIHANVYKK